MKCTLRFAFSLRKVPRHIDVDSVLIIYDSSDIAHGCMYQFMLFCQLAALFTLGGRKGARICQLGYALDIEVSGTRYMDLVRLLHIRSPKVTIECDVSIAVGLRSDLFARS